MNYRAYEKHHRDAASLRGFVPYLAIALWFLVTVLTMQPASAQTIEDDAMQLRAKDILPAIETSLSARGMHDEATITLDKPDLIIGTSDQIDYVSYNPRSGRFSLRVAGVPTPITGRAALFATFPAVTRDIAPGDVITAAHLTTINAPAHNADRFARSDDELIGMVARRRIKAGHQIRLSDLTTPTLVKKGAIVTLAYKIGGLKITHQGVAQSAGGEGDVIAVKNVQSERTVKGVIIASNTVLVTAARTQIAGLGE